MRSSIVPIDRTPPVGQWVNWWPTVAGSYSVLVDGVDGPVTAEFVPVVGWSVGGVVYVLEEY